MPRKIETLVYTYAELKEGVKAGTIKQSAVDKAKQWLSEGNTLDDWWEYVSEMWQQALAQAGFENAEISFSGFWSQGDGASFTASIDLNKLVTFLSTEIEPKDRVDVDANGAEQFLNWLANKLGSDKVTKPAYSRLRNLEPYIELQVERTSHHYSHKRTCEATGCLWDKATTPRLTQLFREFRADVEELRLVLCDLIYKALEAEYEYLTSDEALEELAESNDYTFTAAGKREG